MGYTGIKRDRPGELRKDRGFLILKLNKYIKRSMGAFRVTANAQSGGNAAFFMPRGIWNAERLTCLNARFFFASKEKNGFDRKR